MTKKTTGLLLCLTFFLAGMSRAEGPHRRAKQPPIRQDEFDVCKLLTSDEIRKVQGDGVEESRPTVQSSGGLRMSQCLFRTSAPAHSVSVAVAAPATERPRDFWSKQFHSSAERNEKPTGSAKGSKAIQEQEEAESRPRAIQGVGDEAYWVGGPITGALYVLRGNTFIRLSVGGVREEAARIEKSVALAKLALKRLQ